LPTTTTSAARRSGSWKLVAAAVTDWRHSIIDLATRQEASANGCVQ
jgi:hypothetical protein